MSTKTLKMEDIKLTKEISQEETLTKDTAEQEQDQTKDIIAEEGKSAGENKKEEADEKLIPQEKVNEIVQSRLERERKKYEDKLAGLNEIQEELEKFRQKEEEERRAKMTEQEKIQADLEERDRRLEQLEKERDEYLAKTKELVLEQQFKEKAQEAGVKYLSDAYDLARINYDLDVDEGGEVVGLEDAIKALIEDKPFLLGQAKPIGKAMAQTKEIPKKSADELLKEAGERARRGGRKERTEYLALKRELFG